jgi:hypothetical protein
MKLNSINLQTPIYFPVKDVIRCDPDWYSESIFSVCAYPNGVELSESWGIKLSLTIIFGTDILPASRTIDFHYFNMLRYKSTETTVNKWAMNIAAVVYKP